tara:strand:- start:77 stop:2107 length:2031 start_codon:yes stop_codon:yes gene_type:complete
MGNDFELLYYSYKKYIFEFIRVGHFPKWLPTDSSGYSLIFNPFAQYFYPLSWILYSISALVGDLSKYLFWLYTVFGLSIYNIGQYLWLRAIKIEIKYAFIATLITCSGLKLTEILRFTNAVHAIAWLPWILLGITLSVQKNKKIYSYLIIFASTLMLFTAGYPYYIFYGAILCSIYFLFLLSTKVKTVLFELEIKNFNSNLRFFFNCFIPSIISLLIVSPWFFKIGEIMKITTSRNLIDIKFSSILNSNYIDQLGSWVFPPFALAEGWYYFGIINTILILIFFLSFFLLKNINSRKEKLILIFFLVLFIVNFQFASAENSFLFRFFWENLDFLKNFRIFSRMNIILIPIFSILIALALKKIAENEYGFTKITSKSIFLIITPIIFIIVLQIYFIEISNFKNIYWDAWQLKRIIFASDQITYLSKVFLSHDNYWYLFFTLISFVFLLLYSKIKKQLVIPFILFLTFSELFILSNLQWAIPKNYYNQNQYNYLEKDPVKSLQNSFKKENIVAEIKGNSYFRNLRTFNINYFDDFGIDKHSKLINKYFNRDGSLKNNLSDKEIASLKYFYGLDISKKRLFFSKSIQHNNILDLVEDIKKSEKNHNVIFDIKYDKYLGDEVSFILNTEEDGFVTFVDNWAPGWKAKRNGKDVEMFKTLETYKSVKVSKGKNEIFFKYYAW